MSLSDNAYEVIPAPEPVMRGTFAVYALSDGGRVIAYRPEDSEESTQIPIPAIMMKIWERQAAGEKINPMEIIRAMIRQG